MVVHRLPFRARFVDVKRFGSVPHCFFSEMKFAVYPMAFIVGMSPQIGTRWRHEILITMPIAHRILLPEPAGSSWSLGRKVLLTWSKVKVSQYRNLYL